MFDAHAHPQLKQFDTDRGEVINRALEAGVRMICVGVDLESSREAVELARKYKGIWSAVGLHPNDNLDETFDAEIYKTLAENPKVIAIGETGLDYYRTPDIAQQQIQKSRFLEQIGIAIRLNKPLIIHCRDPLSPSAGESSWVSAHQDMIDILSQNPDARGVIHSFTGTLSDAQKYIELGFYIGLNGIITFPPTRKAMDGQGARDYDDTIRHIPLERIVLETDAPFLAPMPYRGKRNEPGHIRYVAEKLAELQNVSVETVEQVTDDNVRKLFGIQ